MKAPKIIRFATWPRMLSLVFLLALLTRVAFVMTQQDGFYFYDSVQYSNAAVSLLKSGDLGLKYDRAPFYPVFLAGVYSLFGENVSAVRIVEILMGAALAVLIGLIGKRIGGDSVGVVAAGVWSIYPMGIFIAGLIYPTNLAAFLLALGVFCTLPAANEDFRPIRVFLGGLSYGLAALTIPVALLTIVVVAAWIFYWARRSKLWIASLFLLGSALTILPWTARNFVVHEELILVQPNVERHLPRIRTDDNSLSGDKVAAIFRHPDQFAIRFGRNFLRFWELYPNHVKMSGQEYRDRLHAKDSRVIKETIYGKNLLVNAVSILSTAPILFFALLGTVAMWPASELRRDYSMLLGLIFSFAVGYALFVGKIRYRIPVEPYIIILSAYGIKTAYSIIAARFLSFPEPVKERAETSR